MGIKTSKGVSKWMKPDRHTAEAIEQAAKLMRPLGGPENVVKLMSQFEEAEKAAKLQRQIDEARLMARDALKAGAGTGGVPMPDFPETPLEVEMHRAEEHRRLRMAEEEGEARARAEFKTRQELETAHQKELQTTAVTVPPPAPAPATESIADRNARWLTIFDQEERSKPNGAQTRTCERVSEQEGIKPDTVKAALQRAKEERAERIRQGGAILLPKNKGKPKITANNPFGLAKQKS